MSDPLLNYQSSAPGQPTRLITGTFVYLIVLAVLYFLVGACGGISVAFLASSSRVTAPGHAVLWAFAILFVLLTFGSGITFIWTGLRLRRLSRTAAMIAFILACINSGLAFAYDIINTIMLMRLPAGSIPMASAVGGIVFYLLAAIANAVAAILLWIALRQMRRMRLSQPIKSDNL